MIAIIIFVKSLMAFYGFELSRVQSWETKTAAMGNCYLSAAQPATAVIYDPALLGEIDQTEASVNIRFKTGSFDFNDTSYDDFGPAVKKRGTLSPHLKINTIGVAFPLVKSEEWQLGMGLGYHTYEDDTLIKNHSDMDEITNKGGKNALVTGFGLSLMKQFNIGVSYHNSFYSRSISTQYNDYYEEFEEEVYEMPGDYLLFSTSFTSSEKTRLQASYKILNTVYYPGVNLKSQDADILTLGLNQSIDKDNLAFQFTTIFYNKFHHQLKDLIQANIGYNHVINQTFDWQAGSYYSYSDYYNCFSNVFGLTSGFTVKSGKTIDFNIAADYQVERTDYGSLYIDQFFKVYAGLTYKHQ